MKFCWTTLEVADLERSLAFYQGLLGLRLDRRFPAGAAEIVMLGEPGETLLELIGGSAVPPMPGQGVTVGYAAPDLEALVARLREAGQAVEGPVAAGPDVTFYFVSDPDGYRVQLLQA